MKITHKSYIFKHSDGRYYKLLESEKNIWLLNNEEEGGELKLLDYDKLKEIIFNTIDKFFKDWY